MNADRKVLLVEDEVLVAALAVDALEELGFQAIEVTTAKAALEIASTGVANFAFAVIDVGLPDGRGDALAVKLQALRADLPIIVATGYGPSHLDEGLLGNPRVAVLSKPYGIEQLQQAIKSVT